MAEPLKRLFSVSEYHSMAEAGILAEDDRVELIEGEIYRMAAIGSRHAGCVKRLNQLLIIGLAGRAVVGVQDPILLDDISETEPDVSLLRPRDDFYAGTHPTPSDVLLLVEVADTSIGFDRRVKIPLYARHGISEVWLVDLAEKVLEVHRRPEGSGYREVRRLRSGERVSPRAFPDLPVEVGDILS